MRIQKQMQLLCTLLFAVIATAGAQEKDEGIKLGGMTLHPFIAGEIDSDSNVFQ